MSPPTRRQFLASAALASAARRPPTADRVIVVAMTGGPSQLDTFDPKPDAPGDVRGPFGTIPTRTPGVRVSELFPKLATMSDRWSLIRTLTSDGPPVHEAGQTRLDFGGERVGPRPDFGGEAVPPSADRRPFAERLLSAVRSAEPVVEVPMFPTVFDAPSWDCHAAGGSLACDLGDYRDAVAPLFDDVMSRLIRHLHDSGRLSRTLVVAVGEFGRTPTPNCNGGRDHWAKCGTALLAGGGVQGGRVVGRSDAVAGEPADRPVTPAELVATAWHAVGRPTAATPVRELL
jgi:hypothetical protein